MITKKRSPRTQRNRATVRINRALEIPQYQKDHVVILELSAGGTVLGTVTFNGAHVYYFDGKQTKKGKYWQHDEFVDVLKKAHGKNCP